MAVAVPGGPGTELSAGRATLHARVDMPAAVGWHVPF